MKILVADDNDVLRLLLGAELLALGHEVTLVNNGLSAWESLSREQFSLLISDWVMPGMDGPSLCQAVREEFGINYIYIILLTSMCGASDYRDGIAAGADDFLIKPFNMEHLKARLLAAERILALHDQLREQAFRDRLTGLLNRGAILDALEREVQCAARDERGLSVFLVDIDHFKQVNDSFGHAAGDTVLQETARRMQASLRPSDCLGRYGGEEFLMIAPCENVQHAREIGDRLRRKVAAHPISTGDTKIAVTVSVGLVGIRAHSLVVPAELIAAADKALYQAKNAGRNRVEIVDRFPKRTERNVSATLLDLVPPLSSEMLSQRSTTDERRVSANGR